MTRLWNEPADFADEMLDGFSRANARWVRRVEGGVTRSTRSANPEVALVIGGGSGHYPAFGGLVGPGLAHGAAMGNLFASPSANRVASVARESEHGRGVLLSFGNYAGDVLNFAAAQEDLRAAGMDCRTVAVTDDIFSAAATERQKRRGIAGDLAVFKVAGGAAAAGYDLDDVERVARHANERTRSMGVAFTGCTLPGSDEPLFTVPEGRMAIGLGIHGEHGVDEVDTPTADGLAELFVSHLLDPAEIPDGVDVVGARVVPVLNGLGSVKNEELYVVFARIAEMLETAGLRLIDPQVGEFCTSFDMAGASLTLLWLDDELERLWLAPADTPSFRTRAADTGVWETVDALSASAAARKDEKPSSLAPPASDVSRESASRIVLLLARVREVIDGHAEDLGRLDAVAGDGDHGIGMSQGAHAAAVAAERAAREGAGAATVLSAAGSAWADRAGGTSGALWGVILGSIGRAMTDEAPPTAASVAQGMNAAAQAVMDYGKARVGDKTLVDALVPFADTLTAHVRDGAGLVGAWSAAAAAAVRAAEGTADLVPSMGRARTHGAKTLGTPDPGAISFSLIVEDVAHALAMSPAEN